MPRLPSGESPYSLSRAGRWEDLAAVLKDSRLSDELTQSEQGLFAVLSGGHAESIRVSSMADTERLITLLGDSSVVRQRLLAIAGECAPNNPEAAAWILDWALVLFSDQEDVLLAAAWNAYARGQCDKALAHARSACASGKGAYAEAACAWFLLEQGDVEAAEKAVEQSLEADGNCFAAHWYKGLILRRRGRLREAVESLRLAFECNPEQDQVAVDLACSLHEMGRTGDSIQWLRTAISRRYTVERDELLAWYLFLEQEYGQVVDICQSILAAQPSRVAARCHLAGAQQHLGKLDDAVAVIKTGLDLVPGNRDLRLSLGWLHLAQAETERARYVGESLTEEYPRFAAGWHLLGVIWQTGGEPTRAEAMFARAFQLDPGLADAAMGRSVALKKLRRKEEAADMLRALLIEKPDHREALKELAELLIDLDQQCEARRYIHLLLRDAMSDGLLWAMLARIAWEAGRKSIARLMLRRARRFAPTDTTVLSFTGWVELADGNLSAARKAVETLLAQPGADVARHILVVHVLDACGDLLKATRHAEIAVSLQPDNPDVWRALARVRHRQGYLSEADSCLSVASALLPESPAILRQYGWLRIAQERLAEAEKAFLDAARLDPNDASVWLEIAEACHRQGAFERARQALGTFSNRRTDSPEARLLLARVLADAPDGNITEAVGLAEQLIRSGKCVSEASQLLMVLAAADAPGARAALRLIDRASRQTGYAVALERAQGLRDNSILKALAAIAHQDFPENRAFSTAELFAAGLDENLSATQLVERARRWARTMMARTGSNAASFRAKEEADGRIRIAYIAGHLHASLLRRVLAAHDPARAEVFLYCDQLGDLFCDIGQRVVVQPLRGIDLAASMAVNRIDVAIDTVAVHSFVGQQEILDQLARRVAPLQCAWLGSWATGGGLFDVLIADRVSIPDDAETLYDEAILRLPDGQWCWDPPIDAPPCGMIPSSNGGVVFGSAVRSLRLSEPTLEVWAELLRRVPHSRLMLIGEQGRDWSARRRFAAMLDKRGIDPSRVIYRPWQRYADYLTCYRDIHVALDAFPANGGLCLIDPLWMGVPVVTLAGRSIGERQGASLLHAVNHPEWVAASSEEYLTIACGLAGDIPRLEQLRSDLRNEVAHSPLVDGRRVAAALEIELSRHVRAASRIASADSDKARSRAIASRRFSVWLSKEEKCGLNRQRIDFSRSVCDLPVEGGVPDVSVVVVLYNQIGLSWLTLEALADQTGVRFEAIVIDNASADETAELLDRIDGAIIRRNGENLGFLRAANQGASLAQGRHILFLNSDAILMPDALSHAVRRLDADERIGVVGGRISLGSGGLQEAGCIVYRDGWTAPYGRGDDPQAPEFQFVRDVDYCSGAFLMVRRTLWNDLGGFDTAYVPAYYEDTDLCLRASARGFRVVYEPRCRVSHLEWGSAGDERQPIDLILANRKRFADRHACRLAERPLAAYGKPAIDRWRASPRLRVLVIDNEVPHAALGGGLPRARSMVCALADAFHVTFYPLWTYDGDWGETYASLPDTVEVMLGLGAAALESFLEQQAGAYDVLLVSRPPNMKFVEGLWNRRPELFRTLKLVYDAEAIFALREIREMTIRGRRPSRGEIRQRLRDELQLAQRASVVLTVSKREGGVFARARLPQVRVLMHSMAVRWEAPAFHERSGFLFVGSIRPDQPNEDSLMWFASAVLPELRRRLGEDILVTVVGDCLSARVAALATDTFRIVGRVADLDPVYDRHRVFFAPTRFAAGVPAKVIEAACNGLPVVASRLLVRQLGWAAGDEILGAGSADEFIAALVRLHNDCALWSRVQFCARERVRRDADPERFARVVQEVVDGAVDA